MAQRLRALAALPEFESQHPGGGLQPHITPVPGDPIPPLGTKHIHGTQAYMQAKRS